MNSSCLLPGIAIVPALGEHVASLAPRLRPDDAREAWLVYGYSPREALQACLAASRDEYGRVQAWTVLWQGTPEMLFGIGAASLLSDTGMPWMVSSGIAQKMPVFFARRCGEYLAYLEKVGDMGRGYRLLENYVHVGNAQSIRWLAWLGFHFDPPRPLGVHGALFRRFWKQTYRKSLGKVRGRSGGGEGSLSPERFPLPLREV